MNQPIPGTVRSKLDPKIHEALNILGVRFVEPEYMAAVTGAPLDPQISDAVYDVGADVISVADKPQNTHGNANSRTLHEIIHWTGHPRRLGRGVIAKALRRESSTIDEYDTEEATAQIGMYKLSQYFQLDTCKALFFQHCYINRLARPDLIKAEHDANLAVSFIINVLEGRVDIQSLVA